MSLQAFYITHNAAVQFQKTPKLLAIVHFLDDIVKCYSKWSVVPITHIFNGKDHLDLVPYCKPGCLKVNLKKYRISMTPNREGTN